MHKIGHKIHHTNAISLEAINMVARRFGQNHNNNYNFEIISKNRRFITSRHRRRYFSRDHISNRKRLALTPRTTANGPLFPYVKLFTINPYKSFCARDYSFSDRVEFFVICPRGSVKVAKLVGFINASPPTICEFIAGRPVRYEP